MGRARWKYQGIEVKHLKVRKLATKTLYYHAVTGKRLSDDLAEAIRECQQEEAPDVHKNKIDAALRDFRERYLPTVSEKTAYEYGRAIMRLTAVFGHCDFKDIEPHHIMGYFEGSTKKSRAKNDLACFSSFWTWARGQGKHKLPNPREGLLFKKPKKERLYVTDEMLSLLKVHSSPELVDLLDLLYLTGADVNTVLRWKITDIVDGCLPNKRQKTGKGNRLELGDSELKQVIDRARARPRTATGPYIVQTDKGQRLTYEAMKYRLNAARKASGISFELRLLRNKAASDANTDEEAAALLNNDVKTTRQHYRKGAKVRPLR